MPPSQSPAPAPRCPSTGRFQPSPAASLAALERRLEREARAVGRVARQLAAEGVHTPERSEALTRALTEATRTLLAALAGVAPANDSHGGAA